MKEFDLGKYRKARVWLDELPDASCPTGAAQEVTVSATSQATPIQAAVEVFVPLGPRSMYGLLGGEFNPSPTGQLKVTIISGATNGRSLASTLASASDQVRIGLPGEYCEAVKEGVRMAHNEIAAASGHLVISYAAYGEVGSCAAIFKHLAAVLVKLINTQKRDPTDEEIISLFPQSFA